MTTDEIARITWNAAQYWKISETKCRTCAAPLYQNLSIAQIDWSYLRCPVCRKNSYGRDALIKKIPAHDDALDRYHQLTICDPQ